MAQANHYDVLIIGGGQAGIPLSHALARAGKRVALAEREHLGGSCVNFGCTPTKAAIASARLAHLARRGAEFGLKIPSVEVDFRAVVERARQISAASRQRLEAGFASSSNPKLLRGHARLDGREGNAFRVRLEIGPVTAEQVVLNTGTRTAIPPIDGLKEVKVIDAENWLELTELPAHLAIIGGGAIGLEMAQFYRRMGSRVTVIEHSGQIAGHEDNDVADAMQKILAAEGIEFRLKRSVTRVEPGRDGITVRFGEGGSSSLVASHLFIAVGRQPNTDALGLDTVGVAVSPRGIIEANERLQTNVRGVWAAGDIRGGPQFTHTSWDDHRVLLSQMAGDGTRTTRRVVPYAIFTDPELGRVGMSESEARRAGHEIKIGRFDMARNGKAAEIGETQGFIKLVIDARSRLILGAAVLASDGAELVHSYIDVMNARAPYTVIGDAIHIHPTLAEAVQSAALAID